MSDLTQIPRIGLGTFQMAGSEAQSAVRTALEVGYRHIDTAQMYGNEAEVGRGIAESGVAPEEIWVTTKLNNGNLDPDAVVSSTEGSLADLGLDHVDLLLIHWPVQIDGVEATLEAMQSLADRGLVRNLGVSNFTAEQVRRAAKAATITTDQVEYHAMLDQSAVKAAVAEVGGVLTAYSPLAQGKVLREGAVTEIADARGVSAAQVALRWLLDQPDVVVIPKGSSEGHIKANLDALSMDPLTEEERGRLDALPKDRRVVDPPIAPDWD